MILAEEFWVESWEPKGDIGRPERRRLQQPELEITAGWTTDFIKETEVGDILEMLQGKMQQVLLTDWIWGINKSEESKMRPRLWVCFTVREMLSMDMVSMQRESFSTEEENVLCMLKVPGWFLASPAKGSEMEGDVKDFNLRLYWATACLSRQELMGDAPKVSFNMRQLPRFS